MGVSEVEFFKEIVDNFTQSNEVYSSDDNQRKFIALINSPSFERFDRVDYIANIIYELSDEQFVNLISFFGLYIVSGESAFNLFTLNLQSTLRLELNQKNLRKFEEHIKLSCHQRSFIIKNVAEAKTIADDAKKVAEKAEEIKTKIYSEFIAILGIFTAISFMSMGSLQVLGDLFKDVKNPTSISVGYAMIIGGVYISIMYVFIIIMFVGMKKVIGNGDKYTFSTGVCALVLITVCTLIGIGLFMTNCLVPGLMFITVCIVGLIVALLATQSITTEAE